MIARKHVYKKMDEIGIARRGNIVDLTVINKKVTWRKYCRKVKKMFPEVYDTLVLGFFSPVTIDGKEAVVCISYIFIIELENNHPNGYLNHYDWFKLDETRITMFDKTWIFLNKNFFRELSSRPWADDIDRLMVGQ